MDDFLFDVVFSIGPVVERWGNKVYVVRNTITSTAPELVLSISYGIHLALEGLEYRQRRQSHRLPAW